MRSESLSGSSVIAGLCLILAACTTAQALAVFKVAATSDDEALPVVSGDIVVWQVFNRRYGLWDIMAADISDPEAPAAFLIADFNGHDRFPAIDGNDVVWQHQPRLDGPGDIYGVRIEDRQVVARYAVSATGADERLPCISNGVAVWQHKYVGEQDWDILGARLTGEDHPESFIISAAIGIDELYPCISGNLVVWHQRSPGLPQPFVYGACIVDPNRPRTFYTTMALGGQQMPSLSDGWLVGRETDDVGKVMADNLYDPFNPEGISSSALTAGPKIHKHIVVWQNWSHGVWDIRGYNLITRQEFVVTDMRMSDQVNPSVYVDTEAKRAVIVWQDNRDGNWDIYAAILEGPEVATEIQE